jgi:hypothetical protein
MTLRQRESRRAGIVEDGRNRPPGLPESSHQ